MIPDAVTIGYVFGSTPPVVYQKMAQSMWQACLWPDNRIMKVEGASSARQHVARNAVLTKLANTHPSLMTEYFCWVDTDMTFQFDIFAALRNTLKVAEADAIAPLGFTWSRAESRPAPAAWDYVSDEVGFRQWRAAPTGIGRVDAVGSGFVMFRTEMLLEHGYPWHQNWMEHPATGQPMGHDLSLCYDLFVEGPYKLVLDATIEVGHEKTFVVGSDTFRAWSAAQ